MKKYLFLRFAFVTVFIVASVISLPCQSFAEGRSYDFAAIEKMFLEGRYEQVVQESNKLISSRSLQGSELYYVKGLGELKLSRFDDARDSFEHIVSRYSSSVKTFDAYIGIGDAFILEGKINEAIGIYSKVLEKYPNDKNITTAYYRLADCYGKLGIQDKSAYYLNKAKTLSPLSFEKNSPPAAANKPYSNIEVKNTKPDLQKKLEMKPTQIPRTETTGYISVQVGCFKNRKNAEKLSKKLSKEGYDSFVELPAGVGDKLYRVKIGKFKSEPEAQNQVFKLRRQGYSTRICTSDLCQ